MTKYSVQFRGKEVRNPVLRKVVGTIVIVIGVPLTLLMFALMIALSPLIILTHYVLRACGRKGFVFNDGNHFAISVNAQGFRRVR